MTDTMTARDWFAAQMDRDEYGDLSFRNLSRDASTILAGRPYPEEPPANASHRTRAEWMIDKVAWELSVRAAIRFMYADAMLAARHGGK